MDLGFGVEDFGLCEYLIHVLKGINKCCISFNDGCFA